MDRPEVVEAAAACSKSVEDQVVNCLSNKGCTGYF